MNTSYKEFQSSKLAYDTTKGILEYAQSAYLKRGSELNTDDTIFADENDLNFVTIESMQKEIKEQFDRVH